MQVAELARSLVEIPSVSGEESAVLEYLSQSLPQYGFHVRHIPLPDGTYCIVARKGVSQDWIVGHTDTVPGVVPVSMRAGKLYGRGSCDTKGNIAAAIVASVHMPAINLLLTVGEEDTFRGARASARDSEIKRGRRFLVLEPTSSCYHDGQMGAVAYTVTARGKARHSAFIESYEENAIHAVTEALHALGARRLPGFNIGTMTGGIAKNIIAPLCVAEFVVRPRTVREYRATLAHIETVQRTYPHVVLKKMVAFEPIEGVRQLPGFSEAYFFKGKGRTVGVLGAGDLTVAHSAHEHVSVRELEALPEKICEVFRQ